MTIMIIIMQFNLSWRSSRTSGFGRGHHPHGRAAGRQRAIRTCQGLVQLGSLDCPGGVNGSPNYHDAGEKSNIYIYTLHTYTLYIIYIHITYIYIRYIYIYTLHAYTLYIYICITHINIIYIWITNI
jgi:hypothetical protein